MKTWTIDGKIFLLKAENDKPQVATTKDYLAILTAMKIWNNIMQLYLINVLAHSGYPFLP